MPNNVNCFEVNPICPCYFFYKFNFSLFKTSWIQGKFGLENKNSLNNFRSTKKNLFFFVLLSEVFKDNFRDNIQSSMICLIFPFNYILTNLRLQWDF